MLETVLDRAHEALADHGAHRATEEPELERARDDTAVVQRAGHRDQRIALTRLLLRGREPVLVAFGVAELERILRLDAGREYISGDDAG